MSAAKPYVVICHYQLEELEHGVAEHMRAGYVPTGSVSNLRNPEGEDFLPLICQAMVWQPGSGDRKVEAAEVPATGTQPGGKVYLCSRHGSKVISLDEGPDPDGRTYSVPVSVIYWWVDILGFMNHVNLPLGTPGPMFQLVPGLRNVPADKTDGATDGRTA